tara:strand:- start:452 stop:937 length:486 start_codon:yes stop_codon:yes gene_type:complete
MKIIFWILLAVSVTSCSSGKIGIRFKIKVDSELFENEASRALLDTISTRSLQLRKGNHRTLTFAHNFKFKNDLDTSYIEFLDNQLVFKVDSSKTVSRDSDISLTVEPVKYYCSKNEKIDFVLYKDGYLSFKAKKNIKILYEDKFILFHKPFLRSIYVVQSQ